MNLKLSLKEKVFYGLGDLSANIFYSAVSFYLLYFLINVAGLQSYLASLLFIVARAWDAISDYLMGRISDKTKSKWGKRRVYMLFGAIPYGIAFALLWISPLSNSTQAVKFIFYTMMYVLYSTTWTVVYIPYSSLAANITKDYDERTSLNGIKIIMANIGIIFGAAVFSLLAEGTGSILYGVFGSVRTAYAVAGAIFGVLGTIVMIVCTLGVKERYDASEGNDRGFFRTLKEFFKLREFRNIMMYYLLSMVGFDIIMAVFMFFINYSLNFGAAEDSIMGMLFVALPLVMAIASAVLWVKLSEKFQKHKVYFVACIYMTMVLLFALFVPESNIITTVLLCAFAGIGMSAIQILPYASLPDVVEVDEYENGVRREGAFYGVSSFMYKIASGVSVALVGFVLELFNFAESETGEFLQQPKEALMAIRVVLGAIPGVIFMISTIFAMRSRLDRARYQQITEGLAKRRAEASNGKMGE